MQSLVSGTRIRDANRRGEKISLSLHQRSSAVPSHRAGIEGIILFYLTSKNEYLILEIKMEKKEERLH
jgi:hypothetical protein